MALSLRHAFTSSKSDGGDATLVQPSNWNASHAVTMAIDNLLGTTSSSTTATEIPCTAQGRAMLSAATIAALTTAINAGLFTTGDAKLTLKVTADTGWVMANDGTIGDASSSSSTRANADTEALFTLIFNNLSDTWAQIFTSAGSATSRVAQSNAAAAFAAHCRISIPKSLGRAFAVAGSGAGLTARSLGQFNGEENHTLTIGEMPNHDHGALTGGQSANHTHDYQATNVTNQTINTTGGFATNNGAHTATSSIESADHAHGINGQGGGAVHNNMQPTVFWNAMIKL